MADEALESAEDFGKTSAGVVRRYMAEVHAYEKAFKDWEERSSKVVRRYRDESLQTGRPESSTELSSKGFNIFWSNVQTLRPALFSKMPNPVVRRRNKDRDPSSLAAAEILKRSLFYQADCGDYVSAIEAARDDYLLVARGTIWIRYEPVFGEERRDRQAVTLNEDQEYLNEDGVTLDADTVSRESDGSMYTEGDPYRPVIDEKVHVEHVPWTDFGHSVVPSWKHVDVVWRKLEPTREYLIDRFGDDKGKQVALTRFAKNVDTDTAPQFGETFRRAELYEVWDKSKRKVYWISPGYPEGPLDEMDDPLHLYNFFPCPKPLYATTTTNTMVPVPDYVEYQAQALQLDILTQRISALSQALKLTGAYNGEFPALQQILKNADGTLVPVDNWAMFAEQGALPGAITFVPIKEVAEVLRYLIEVRNQVKQDLYEVTGLSDLVRGQSDASASATAERIKGQFVTLRMKDRQRLMERFVRDALAIVAEIMAEHFSPSTLIDMSGWDKSPNAQALGDRAPVVATQAFQLMRSDRLRTFRIDVETDATILEDVEREKGQRIEFLQAVSAYLQQAMPAIQQFPDLEPLMGEMLMYGVRAFNKGSELEEVFETTLDKMRAGQSGSRQPAPAEQAQLAESQGKVQSMQIEAQTKQQQLQLQVEDQRFQQQLKGNQQQLDEQRYLREFQLQMRELDLKFEQLRLEQARLEHDRTFAYQQLAQDKQIADDKVSEAALMRQQPFKDEMETRRLDGKMTETLEEDVKDVAESILKLAEAIGQMAEGQRQLQQAQVAMQQQQNLVLQALTAPRRLVRNPDTGQIEGAELDLAGMDVEGSA